MASLKISKNEYSASNFSMTLSDDMKDINAMSYGWWQFVYRDKAGNIIFNDAWYSNSTSRHQREAWGILRRLGLRVSLKLKYTNKSIDHPDSAIKHEIKILKNEIAALHKLINKKGTHKRKNKERVEEIKMTEYRINDLERFLNEYLDKKYLKPEPNEIITEKPEAPVGYNGDSETDEEYRYELRLVAWKRDRIQNESYKDFFLKPNGKLQRNEFIEFLKTVTHLNPAPDTDKLVELLGLKKNDMLSLLHYRFTEDLNAMLPAPDTAEHTQLLRWLKRNNISRKTLNTFALDKIHEYLTNKQNRKEYSPSEPTPFPLPDHVQTLESVPHLRLIKNDKDLRSEGRKQSHCIGSTHYIKQCLKGNYVIHYKGYTFYFDRLSNLICAYGRYNAHTPEKIKQELLDILNERKEA